MITETRSSWRTTTRKPPDTLSSTETSKVNQTISVDFKHEDGGIMTRNRLSHFRKTKALEYASYVEDTDQSDLKDIEAWPTCEIHRRYSP